VITIGEVSVGATLHVEPPFSEYSLRIALRPPELPGVNATDKRPSDDEIDSIVGAAGAPAGITVLVADSRPAPAMFTALIKTSYAVPFARLVRPSAEILVIVIGLLVIDAPGSRMRQVAPPSVEYS
jgi:hypothetical protein